MIIKVFDNGWGQNFPLKQFEQTILNNMLVPILESPERTVVINSVWYSEEFDTSVMTWLRDNDFDHIVLVAMLDAAIPYPDRYAQFARPVSAVGYYKGDYHVDFCALFVQKFMQPIDTMVLLDLNAMDIPFMCLNRKPHWHRQKLYRTLQELKIVDRGLVSMGSVTGEATRTLPRDRDHDDLAPNAESNHYGIPNDIASLGQLSNWRSTFLNVVTETFWNINQTGFVSEKIYKPIVGCRPFLVYDSDGGTEWLHKKGFLSFVDDFGDISDLDLRDPNSLGPFLKVLVDQHPTYFKNKFLALQEKILYNKQHFAVHVQRQYDTINRGISCPI
jgi:hypothetical protein